MKLASILVFVTCLGVSLPALAQTKKGGQGNETEEPKPKKGVPRRHEPKPAPIQPKDPPKEVGLGTARSLFKLTDADGNGTLDLKEASSAGLGPRDLAAGDLDSNHLLSESEFLVAYDTNQSRLGRPVSKDLKEEAAKVAAARPAPPAQPQANLRTAPEVASTPKPAASAKSELEQKIEQALRVAKQPAPQAESGEAKPEPKRERRPGAHAQTGDFGAKRHQSLAELNRRIRNGELTPEEAAEERRKLEQRAENAKIAKAEAAASVTDQVSTESAAGASGDDLEARIRQELEDLQRRLRNAEVTPEEAAEQRRKLEARIENARKAQSAPRPEPGAPLADEPAVGAAPMPAASPEEVARAAMEKRLADEGATPEQVAEARARFEARLGKSKRAEARREKNGGGSSDAGDASEGSDEAPETPRLTPEEAAARRAKHAERLQQSKRAEAKRENEGEASSGSTGGPASESAKPTPEEVAARRAKFAERKEKSGQDTQDARSTSGDPKPGTDATDPPAESTPPPAEPAPRPEPAPAPSGDARTKVVGDNLEKRLAAKGASPEEIAKARERLEKRAEAAARRERAAPDEAPQPAPAANGGGQGGTEPSKDSPPAPNPRDRATNEAPRAGVRGSTESKPQTPAVDPLYSPAWNDALRTWLADAARDAADARSPKAPSAPKPAESKASPGVLLKWTVLPSSSPAAKEARAAKESAAARAAGASPGQPAKVGSTKAGSTKAGSTKASAGKRAGGGKGKQGGKAAGGRASAANGRS